MTTAAAARWLASKDNIVLLAHRKPDGDTLGACFGLLYALQAQGKTARVECADALPDRFWMLYGGVYLPAAFEPECVVACDVASLELLGVLAERYPQVDLCIDHHKSNTHYAARTLVDVSAAATTELMYRVITAMGVQPDTAIATALYTGLTTDTGCFRFSNVTRATHQIAAELIACGAPHALIDKQMFDNKSRERIALETAILQGLEYSHDGRCAIIFLPADVYDRFSVTEDDLDGISALPRRIQGVLCGITIREKPDGTFRVSMRCEPPLDACEICAGFGGGGHAAAAGCEMAGLLEDVKEQLRQAVTEAMQMAGLSIKKEIGCL